MTRATRTASPTPPAAARTAANAFLEQVEQALARSNDPHWLGAHSPLAAPYLLNHHIADTTHGYDDTASSALARGQVLQQMLRIAADVVAEEHSEGAYRRRLLELSFFDPKPRHIILSELGVSKNTYYEHRKQTIQQLAQVLIARLNPALRVETPMHTTEIIGRDTDYQQCREALQQHQTVALIGLSGVGKTTLGAEVARGLADHMPFWFTLRPGLNDTLSSVFFALGHAIYRHGAAGLWQQVVATSGTLDAEVAMSLLRQDVYQLEQAGQPPLLLCFDELDLLRPTEIPRHNQLLAFLEGLRGMVALLLIGQYLPLDADVRCELRGFAPATTAALLAREGIVLDDATLQQLQSYTWGNPRLIELFLALHQDGEPLARLLHHLPAAPSLEALCNRIWQRLDQEEQATLLALSVYRRPIAAQDWERQPLHQLIRRHLVARDASGGVEVLPAFRSLIGARLPAAQRAPLHLAAAAARLQRGEYTEAAYHLVQGGEADTAIWVWYLHRTQEINQGQGYAAREIFGAEHLDHAPLSDASRDLLRLVHAELSKLVGDYDQVRSMLADTLHNPVFQFLAERLQGDIAEMRNDLDEALRHYTNGLHTVERLLTERVFFRKNLAWTWMRHEQFDHAWREVELARYELANIQGQLCFRQGRYANAETHYREALRLAEALEHLEGEAKTHDNLGVLLAHQERFDGADEHLEAATHRYQRIGRVNAVADMLVNRAFFLNLAGHHAEVLPLAHEASTLFVSLGDICGEAVAAQNLAEAHMELGDLDAAQEHAQHVVQLNESYTRPDGLRVLAEIHLRRGALTEAEHHARQALEAVQQIEDSYLEAYVQRTLGQVYLAQMHYAAAHTAFERAMNLFQTVHLPREVERTLSIFMWVPTSASS
jgi:tetratricopeptide (TPR) repeat protein